jgi:glycosyltransferase involved in cell wall biosynthesis
MILGVVWDEESHAAYYRAIYPMQALEKRGHQIVWPPNERGDAALERLLRCDVVHVYRRSDEQTRSTLERLVRRGVPLIFDNDDDVSSIPKESPEYKEFGGLKAQQVHRATVKAARLAHTMTTPSEALADRYHRRGIPRLEVIGNYVNAKPRRRRRRHSGIVLGWIAGLEHNADARSLRISSVLRTLLEKHPDLRVECIGVDLKLPDRYRHDLFVPFERLPSRISGWDIAIAPLADIPFNRTRSDIKVKEYAACGVPWLASPLPPYQGLGEEQGGRLVQDDGWLEAIDRLVGHTRERKRLARRARSWGKRQTVEAEIRQWESLFRRVASERA